MHKLHSVRVTYVKELTIYSKLVSDLEETALLLFECEILLGNWTHTWTLSLKKDKLKSKEKNNKHIKRMLGWRELQQHVLLAWWCQQRSYWEEFKGCYTCMKNDQLMNETLVVKHEWSTPSLLELILCSIKGRRKDGIIKHTAVYLPKPLTLSQYHYGQCIPTTYCKFAEYKTSKYYSHQFLLTLCSTM